MANSQHISYVVGDATYPQGSGAKVIVHVCNDIGGWGKGFVLALSQRWSEPEDAYRAWYAGEKGTPFELGEVQFIAVSSEICVANLIGQRDVRAVKGVQPVRYDAIQTGLAKVSTFAKQKQASVHMPRIGCGLAGGDWNRMEQIVVSTLVQTGISVTVYELP